jgi:ribosomal protein L11 methyltransferase
MKLGAAGALAVDVDPLALEAARYNAQRNAVVLAVHDARDPLPGLARITVANILANPLRMLAPVIAAHTVACGHIALSGILEDQAEGVIDAYAPFAHLEVAEREAGWVLVAGKRHG